MLLHQNTRIRRNLNHWHCIILSTEQMQEHQHKRITRLFLRALRLARWTDGMSLWIERKDGGGANIYVSPAAVAAEPGLVHHFNAVSCVRPSQSSQLLAGPRPRELALLPTLFTCRSVRRAKAAGYYQRHEMSSFVRRYLDAWRHSKEQPETERLNSRLDS